MHRWKGRGVMRCGRSYACVLLCNLKMRCDMTFAISDRSALPWSVRGSVYSPISGSGNMSFPSKEAVAVA